jgi:hypothetical protein
VNMAFNGKLERQILAVRSKTVPGLPHWSKSLDFCVGIVRAEKVIQFMGSNKIKSGAQVGLFDGNLRTMKVLKPKRLDDGFSLKKVLLD